MRLTIITWSTQVRGGHGWFNPLSQKKDFPRVEEKLRKNTVKVLSLRLCSGLLKCEGQVGF